MTLRPKAVLFDVVETLVSLDPVRARWDHAGLPAERFTPWFLRLQRDAMAMTLSGDFAAWLPVARQALRVESGLAASDDAIDHVLEGFDELTAYPDTEPALRKLAAAGIPAGCLTVGDPVATRKMLDRNGLGDLFAHIITADEIGAWKPAPATYRFAAERLGTAPETMALVAVHAWDCHGAHRAGCLTGWCDRLEGEYGEVFARPDAVGHDLVEVIDRLLTP